MIAKKVHVCWSKIKLGNGSKYFVDKFYQILFDKYPETKALFPTYMKKQNSALLNMLDNVINGIKYIDELDEILLPLGKRHQEIGVDVKLYDVFVEIVVESAIDSANHCLTDSEITEWEKAFRMVSERMIQGY